MNSAGQALVQVEIAKLLSESRSEKEQLLISSLTTAALRMIKPVHSKELKNLTLQSFSSDSNAWMGFYFSRENCEVMLQVFESAFGNLVEVVYRDDQGVTANKTFSMEERKSFESYRSQLLNVMNVEVRKF